MIAVSENFIKSNSLLHKLIFFSLVLYFSVPKINIISIAQFGIRPLDIVSIGIFIVMLVSCRINIKFLTVILSFFIFESCLGLFFSGPMSVVYAARFIQYIIIGMGLFLILSSHYRRKFLFIIFFIQVLMCVLQVFSVVPNFDPGRGTYYGTTFSGSFGTPAELSYFIVVLFGLYASLLFRTASVLAFLILFNGVLFASFSLFLLGLKKIINLLNQRVILSFSYVLLTLLVLIVLDFDVFIDLLSKPLEDNTILRKGGSVPHGTIIPKGFESFEMRINKFFGVYDYMRSNIVILFVGCGYGCGNGAIDSGLVRLLLEFGVIGLFLVFYHAKKLPVYSVSVILIANFVFDGMWSSVTAPIIISYCFFYFNNSGNYHVRQK